MAGIPIQSYLYMCSCFPIIKMMICQKGTQVNLIANKMDGEPHAGLRVKKWGLFLVFPTSRKLKWEWESTCHLHWRDYGCCFWTALKSWGPRRIPFSPHAMNSYPCMDSLSFYPLVTSSLTYLKFLCTHISVSGLFMLLVHVVWWWGGDILPAI